MADELVVEMTGASPAARTSVSWGAIFAGAFVIAATGLLLIAIGAGFGLSAAAPGPDSASIATLGASAVIWLVVVQWISSGLGGYVAGRLRPRWAGLHSDESYFRDTAHGVVAWAVAAVVSAAVIAGAATMVTGGTVAAGVAKAPSPDAGGPQRMGIVDTLFRSDSAMTSSDRDPRPEAARILATAAAPGNDVSDADRSYLASVVAARTGLSQAEARKRVDDAIGTERQAVDAARKAARTLALVTGFSMLIGAFIAGVAAKLAGQHRDEFTAV